VKVLSKPRKGAFRPAASRPFPPQSLSSTAACKIPGSIRSDCYKAQVAGTSSLPRCLYALGPRAVALYRVTPGEDFAAAPRAP
jgi:hypothetical protein